jgi:hypothetical protein
MKRQQNKSFLNVREYEHQEKKKELQKKWNKKAEHCY